MAFWSENSMAPMRNFRWQLQIDGMGNNKVVYWAKTVSVPSFDVSETEHNYFDNKFFFPGRVTWTDVEVTMVDPVEPSSPKLLMEMLKTAGYNVPTAPGAKETLSKKKSSSDGIQAVTLTLYDAEGVTKEKWVLKNPWIKAAKFGDMDYSNDDLREVSLTIKYDWAVRTDT